MSIGFHITRVERHIICSFSISLSCILGNPDGFLWSKFLVFTRTFARTFSKLYDTSWGYLALYNVINLCTANSIQVIWQRLRENCMLGHFNPENILVLLMRQSLLLEVCEHEEVGHHQEGKTERVIHSFETKVHNCQRSDSLEAVTETCAHAEKWHQFLRNCLDIADDSGFADGT